MAQDVALETTLMHNLATSLRKRGKHAQALKLHRNFKDDIEKRELQICLCLPCATCTIHVDSADMLL